MLKAIAAVNHEEVIGIDNERGEPTLPWFLPPDLRRFQTLTKGHTVIMGRRTWQSLPKALPGRVNAVLTRGAFASPSANKITPSEVLKYVDSPEVAWIIGGSQIYDQFLPHIAEFRVTEVYYPVDVSKPGVTYLPYLGHFFSEATRSKVYNHCGIDYQFVTYLKK